MSSVSTKVNGNTQTLVSNRSYRPDGLLSAQTFGNNISETRTYDLQGRLTYQYLTGTTASIDTRAYSYDANGNLTQEQSLPQVGSYTYDAENRLTQDSITSSPASSAAFTYDGNGNRTKKDTAAYSYTSNTNRLTQIGSNTLTLDANGNLTNYQNTAYSYSEANRLATVTVGGVLKASYTYNALNLRTRKVQGSTVTVYHYDLNGNLLMETTSSGTARVLYLTIENTPIAMIRRAPW